MKDSPHELLQSAFREARKAAGEAADRARRPSRESPGGSKTRSRTQSAAGQNVTLSMSMVA